MSTHRDVPRGTYTRGYLPHRDHDNLIQAITFRLADGLPEQIVGGLNFMELDHVLDRGHGSCLLRDHAVASIVRDALHFFDGARYDLGPWVIMPNHVHVLVRPRSGQRLGAMVHSWKSFTAKQINALTGRTGPLWQREYFDRFVRDPVHLRNMTRYIHENPVVAGLVANAASWEFSSAGKSSYFAALAADF